MLCTAESWVFAALASWTLASGLWLVSKLLIRRKGPVHTTVGGKSYQETHGEAGGMTFYMVSFREHGGDRQTVNVSRRFWKKLRTGDDLTVYKRSGRKVRYAHESKPIATGGRPFSLLFMVNLPFTIFLPIVAAMALAGDFDFELLPWCVTG